MLARLGLPSPQIATKLYGTIALSLAVVYLLATATLQFASQTEQVASRFLENGLAGSMLAARIEVLLEQHAHVVAEAALAPDQGAKERDAGAYHKLTASIVADMERAALGGALREQFANLAASGAIVLDLAHAGEQQNARNAVALHANAAADFNGRVAVERDRSLRRAQAELDALAASSRSLVTWVCAAAAITGLLIGPAGLLLLRRVLARLQGIGSALNRLARNDTSVDIPGLDDQDEVGQLARSASVFKAKSIELLQKKAEFERLNLQLDAAINNMPLGLSMFDAQERLLVCNKRYAEMYELPGELTRPGTVHCALWEHRTKRGARHSQLQGIAADARSAHPSVAYPGSMIIEFGSERVIAVSRQPLKGGGWVALHEDVTQRRRQEAEITHLARHDPLTGLANRVLFREQLEASLHRLVRGQGFAVLYLDLDHFKSVNDTLGHPIGDALLKEVSHRLLGCVRHGDLVARLGGDEFAIIQASARDINQTETLAARIVETVIRPYEIEGHRVDIGTSIGITLAPRDGSDADQLLKNADLALYRTKARGRRGYSFFEPEMNEQIQQRRALEVDLREALDNEDLEIHYQPMISLATQEVTGFEALLRWTHPERGDVPPEEFITIAEEIGLIPEIGAWALRRACAQAARWPSPIRISLNLSPLQFMKRDLIDIVLQALAASGLPPQRLELEITEAVLLQDNQHTLAMLHQLRQLGVRITMDDFGTGYCSLSNLRAFPFDKIKVDKAFIADIERREESRSIVETIIGLGRTLGMTTVAEGIETHEQLLMVRGWGCAEAQGFMLSPPVPSAQTASVLANRSIPVDDPRTGALAQNAA